LARYTVKAARQVPEGSHTMMPPSPSAQAGIVARFLDF
jgi:hypothetical protein